MDPNNIGLREDMAWPARPQDTYGLEKLYAEEMALSYAKDFPIKTRIARYHNVYGPRGTWMGGREKVPAAFCRKAACSTVEFEVWGDGLQTRSFMFIDDCVDGYVILLPTLTAPSPPVFLYTIPDNLSTSSDVLSPLHPPARLAEPSASC